MEEFTGKLSLMQLRKRAGFTQQQLAVAMGKSVSSIAKWESGQIIPRLTPVEFRGLRDILHCSYEELVEAFTPKSENA